MKKFNNSDKRPRASKERIVPQILLGPSLTAKLRLQKATCCHEPWDSDLPWQVQTFSSHVPASHPLEAPVLLLQAYCLLSRPRPLREIPLLHSHPTPECLVHSIRCHQSPDLSSHPTISVPCQGLDLCIETSCLPYHQVSRITSA